MAKRIISAEGIAVAALQEDLYTVIPCIDGYDYIVELEDGVKVWKMYMPEDEDVSEELAVEEKPLLQEDLVDPKKEKPKKSTKKKVQTTPKQMEEQVPLTPLKKITKKVPAEDKVKEDKPKKTVVKKEHTDGVEKKLSEYHMFIRDFLSKNADIVWSDRMKAANAAYKVYKDSKK